MANEMDITKLSYAELQKLIQEAEAARDAKRGEELKVIVDACAKKLQAAGFSIKEGLAELANYDTSTRKRALRGSVVKVEKAYQDGVVYRRPQWRRMDRRNQRPAASVAARTDGRIRGRCPGQQVCRTGGQVAHRKRNRSKSWVIASADH